MAIYTDHFALSLEAKRLSKRVPQFRMMPEKKMGGGVVRLAAIVELEAVVRRPGGGLFLVPVKEWNVWPVCTADGAVPMSEDANPPAEPIEQQEGEV